MGRDFRLKGFVFFMLGLVCVPFVFGETTPAVLTEIQNQYEKTADMEANFVQEYIGKVMQQSQKGEGKVFFKKKGMMRWDYRIPNQKLISDGRTLWLYLPEENQVFISPAEKMIKEFGFLVGEGDLRRDFKVLNIHTPSSQKEETIVIEMTPKEPQPVVSKFSLTVNKKTYFVTQVDVFDPLGNVTRTRFMDIKTNVNLPGSFFQFRIPPGTEIIRMKESSASGGSESQKK